MARRQRADITEDQFKKAIAWLENGGTKKGACEILGVSNNKTMESRIEEYKTELEVAARMRKEKRRQPCTGTELANIIEDYFDEATFEELSKRYYRSTAYIKHRLELAGALIRARGERNPLNPPLLPEECVLLEPDFACRERVEFECNSLAEFDAQKKKIIAEKGWQPAQTVDVRSQAGKWRPECAIDFKGEIVWLPGYQCLAEVVKEVPSKQGKAYRLYLLDADRHQYVNVMYWDIGSLRHLEKLGVDIKSRGTYLNGTACIEMLNKALLAARKSK
ncbi:helicase [Vibrio phage River4]|uniref:D2 protein n=1 Tax=Vibrio phage River4 TaxID=2736288 RepID=A0A6M9Z1R7_9CAUD|nr:helicase [Vibrio phage River4]QKN84730.1 D2 protein [Vibrio phage River4]